MNEENLIVTGGSGILGTELKKILQKANFPSHEDFDITKINVMEKYLNSKDIKCIIHCAAITNLQEIRKDSKNALETNIIGTGNIVKICMDKNIKLIYISTDYVFKGDKGNYKEDDELLPINKYAWSKLGGECAVKLYDNSLIIRTSFGKDPFPYENAFNDQLTIREHVRETAKKIKLLINKEIKGIIHIGGSKKTVYDYAKEISPEKKIGKISIFDIELKIPKDTSLNLEKYNSLVL